jgi:hypothetical protein
MTWGFIQNVVGEVFIQNVVGKLLGSFFTDLSIALGKDSRLVASLCQEKPIIAAIQSE